MAEDGKIVYKVQLDDSDVEQRAQESGDKAGKAFGSGMDGKLKTAAKAIGAAALTAGTAVVSAGSAIAHETNKLAEYGDHIDKMSQKLGMSAEAYQEWDAILQHSGASIDGLEPAMKSLFQAAQKGSEAFDALGISQEQAASMSQEDLFSATVTALQNVTDENERAALSQQLLGRGAQELAPLLNTSAEETEAMRQRVHELGGVLSDEAVKSAAKYKDTLQDMQTAMQGVSNQLMSEFLPDITSIMEGITEIFAGDSDKGIALVTEGLNDMLERMIEAIPQIVDVGGQIVLGLVQGLIDNLQGITETGIDLLLTLIDGITAALPQLIESAPKIIESLVTGIITRLPQIISSGIKLILALGKGLIEALPQLIAMLPQIILAIIETFRNVDWASIGSNIVNGVWNGIKGLWNTLVQNVQEAVNNLWESAKRALGIASPSKKFKYIGEMTTEGTIEGIEDTEAEMTRTVTDVYSGLSDAASASLTRDLGSLEQNVSYNMTATGKLPDMTIVVPLTLDGREIARATAWSMGEQLAWEEL